MKIKSPLLSKGLSFNYFHVISRLILAFCLVAPSVRAADLALTGTASQSSDYSALGLAYKAIDGNRDGVFSDGSVSHTIQPSLTNEWWIVDLGGVKPVDSVTLWNRSDCCGNRMSNLRVALLDGSNNEVYGVNITNGNAVAQGGARGFPMPFGAQGRYVRVLSLAGTNMDGNKIIAMAEVEVWGHNTYSNLARNPLAVASQSSTISPASNAIDGNADPIFADGSVAQTDPAVTNGTYWEVNLGALCVINEIWLFNRNDLGTNLGNFRVSVFGTNNNEVFGTNCLVGSGSVANGGTFNVVLGTPAEGTRVRVALLNNTNNAGNSILALTEAQVYGSLGPDLTPPQLVNVVNYGTNRLFVQFSEPVTVDTATNPANYAIAGTNGAVAVTAATLDTGGTQVTLFTGMLTYNLPYILTVNGVSDRASARNIIAPNSQISFTLADFVLTNIGNAAISGSLNQVPGGFDMTAAGSGTAGTSDQFMFWAQTRSGDFDMTVRIPAINPVNPFTRAGLMARTSLAANSAFVAVWAAPQMDGGFFQWRSSAGGQLAGAGSFPVNDPCTWLRLQRSNSVFTGYAGYDGANWKMLGSATVTMNDPIYFGLAATSADPKQAATLQFRDQADATGTGLGKFQPTPNEPIGPSSRRTGLVITEIMYNPLPLPGTNNSPEFLELYNTQSIAEDISGYRISGDVDFRFPPGTIMPPGGLLVVARHPDVVQSLYGISGVMGPYTNGLAAGGGTVHLRNSLDAILLEVLYDNNPPWPLAADGLGHSLVLARPSYGEGYPQAWAPSDVIGGSPGRLDPYTFDPQRAVMINEVLGHTNGLLTDFIELYNHSSQPVDVSGCLLSDDANSLSAVVTNAATTNHVFRLPVPTVMAAHGFVSFDRNQLGFGLNTGGGKVYLANSNYTRVLDAVAYGPEVAGISLGRVPDGYGDFRALVNPTPGTNNSRPLLRDIVINEIMHSPISGNNDDQYVELYNKGTNAVDLSGWRFTSGITFLFPSNVVLRPDGYLVVAANLANLLAHYPGTLNANNTLGDFTGSLSGNGELLALSMPDYTVKPDSHGRLVTNVNWVVENEVTYGSGGRWGYWNGGGGSSLELKDSHSDNRYAANWADSDETAKSSWTFIDYTATMGDTPGNVPGLAPYTNDSLHVYLLDIGEALVDDIEVYNSSAPSQNLLGTSGTFENATLMNVTLPILNANSQNIPSSWSGYWVGQGAYDQSTIDTGNGYNGTKCLHLRGADHGDPGPNKVKSPAFSPVASPGNPITIRAKARWLRGWPEILLRLHGGTVEACGRLNVPLNLGTPGARNSCAVSNTGPAILEVAHSPVMPAANESVVVTARAFDPDGLNSLRLMYRIDPSTNFVAVNMVDDGTGGDVVAGDGLYSGTIPGQAANATVAFYVQAMDARGAINLFPQDVFPPAPLDRHFPNDSYSRECVVRFGDVQMPGAFATYHLWMTYSTSNRWATREPRSNADLDFTFVYNNYRAVYNGGARFSGSAFHRGQQTTGPSGANRCDFNLGLPEDDRVLGDNGITLDLPGNTSGANGTDFTGQCEQISQWLFYKMGMNFNYRRYVHVFANGSQRSQISGVNGNFVVEDCIKPGGNYIKCWYPNDSGGELIKLDDWFEFDDGAVTFLNNDADLQRRLITVGTNSVVGIARYRFMWQRRGGNAGESANDYSAWLALLNGVSPTTDDNASVNFTNFNAVANVEQWMREFAVQRCVGNFDSYGYTRGKNNYIYKPVNGRFEFLPFDVDWAMGQSSRATNEAVLTVYSDPRTPQMYNNPDVRRAMMRAFKEVLDNYFNNAYLDPLIDARAAAFTQNNVSYLQVNVDAMKAFITGRRAYLLSYWAGLVPAWTNAFNVSTPSYQNTATNVVTFSGTAPVSVRGILVNGVAYPVAWSMSDYVSWTVRVVCPGGATPFVIQAYDEWGNPIAGATRTVTVNVTAPLDPPQGYIVINEIMYNPAVSNASYVELFNRSTNTTFDLTGFRLDGLDYSFPANTLMTPRGYLVLTKSATAFTAAYGASVTPFAEFPGSLNLGGGTLKLVKSGATPDQDAIISQVRYEPGAPWPQPPATISGVSLQLIDPSQDASRVNNWSAGGVWTFFSFTGSNPGAATRLYMYLDSAGDVYLDDIMFVPGTVAGVGTNALRNGDFEAPLANTWFVSPNKPYATNSIVSTQYAHAGNSSLHLVFTNAGLAGTPTTGAFLYQDFTNGLTVTTTDPYTLSFWYLPTTHATNLTVRTASSGFRPVINVRPVLLTPGTTNSVAGTVIPYPLLWLNEVQPINADGYQDNTGAAQPWVELFNSGTNALSLSNFFLANSFTNLNQWAFPSNAVLGPGNFLVVFADGQPQLSTGAVLHTSFRLNPTNGSIVLSRGPQILDYINYSNVPPHYTFGSSPDGQLVDRQLFFYPTPGASNNPASPPITVVINEWMAGNIYTMINPATGKADDWFELYNYGTNAADLSGYYLTQVLTNKTKFQIPSGYTIAPHGLLLVWADKKPSANLVGAPNLHVNFKLTKAGDSVGLFAPDGTMIDGISFTNMTTDISQGRYPDGGTDIYYMTTPTPGATNVIEVNAPPVLAPIADTTVDEGTLLTFTASATDADLPAETLTFSLVPGTPDGAAIDPLTGLFTWIPTEAQGGSSYLIAVKVTDNGTRPLSDIKTFMVTVNKVNSPPYFGGNPGPLVVGVLHTLTFTNVAFDNDLPPDHLTFALVSAPSGVSLDPNTGIVTWTPTPAQAPSSNAIVVRIYDDGTPSLSATQTVTVLVAVVNNPPQLTRPSDRTMDEMTPLVVNLTATDSDLPLQKLTFSLVSAPTGVVLDGDTGVLNWTPTERQGPSTNVITVAVSDNGTPSLSATQSFTVTVREVNQPPVLEAVTNQTIGALTSLVITNLASDPDWPPNQLTFALLTGPTNATLNPSNGVFAWTPALAQSPSTNLIVISVTDDGLPPLSATQSFTIIVSVTNTAPFFVSNPGSMTISELTTLVFTNLASDADVPANKLTFALLAAPDGVTLDVNTGVITWTPTEAQGPSSNAIVLRVFDDGIPSLSATQTVTVFVTEVNTPPILTVNPIYFINEMQTLEVSLSAYDPDIPQETLTFGLVSGPEGMFLDPSGGWLLWTPTEAQGPSTNTVRISIGDNGVPPITVTQSFLVVVLEINNPPVLDAIPDRVIHAGSTLTLTNHATDSDIPANLLTYTLGSAPSGASVNPASGVFTWTPSDPQAGSSYGVTVIVTDDGLPPMNDQKTFHITVAGRPSLQIAAADGAVTLTCSTIPRQTYRVEYSDDLTTPLWNPLPGAGNLSSQTGADISFTDTYGLKVQRFYRLVAYP